MYFMLGAIIACVVSVTITHFVGEIGILFAFPIGMLGGFLGMRVDLEKRYGKR